MNTLNHIGLGLAVPSGPGWGYPRDQGKGPGPVCASGVPGGFGSYSSNLGLR